MLMRSIVHCRSCASVVILAVLAGCDWPLLEPSTEIMILEAPETNCDLYVRCAESDASTILELTVATPETGEHHESFPLHVMEIAASRYPSHPGGVVSACGPPSSGDGVAFNRSCYIESATENAVGIRFRLSYRSDGGTSGTLDELIWATIDRDAVIQLPRGATATIAFSTPSL